jgi:hypothetical protein
MTLVSNISISFHTSSLLAGVPGKEFMDGIRFQPPFSDNSDTSQERINEGNETEHRPAKLARPALA